MTVFDIINLISSIASLILSVVAIALSLYFYDKSKQTEKEVGILLVAIRTQTTSLENLTGKWMDRLTRYATSPKAADEITVLMMEIIKASSVQNITSQLSSPDETTQTIRGLTNQLVSSYIGMYYYVALTNIFTQGYLPPLTELEDNNPIKNIVDSSNTDFLWLDNILSSIDDSELKSSPLHHLYIETVARKSYVKDSTSVYQSRSTVEQI